MRPAPGERDRRQHRLRQSCSRDPATGSRRTRRGRGHTRDCLFGTRFRFEAANESSTRAGKRERDRHYRRRQLGGPIVASQVFFAVLAPKQTQSLTFSNLGAVSFASPTQLEVHVRTGADEYLSRDLLAPERQP